MRTPQWVVTLDEALRLIRVTRTPVPYTSAPELEASMRDFKELRRGDRAGYRLLLDVRDGPLRNDEDFESVMRRYRPELFEGFAGMAILVKTAIGKLQMARIQRDEGTARAVFTDEREALAYLNRGSRGA